MKISTGRSRKDTKWKVIDCSWEDLAKKLSKTRRTSETVAEYKAMTKDERSAAKDIGGFVGGVIEGGRRFAAAVTERTLVTLDADYASKDLWEEATDIIDNAMLVYSTHSHLPKSPRLRVIIPLDRPVSPTEYGAIARRVAEWLGIEQFDVTTYEVNRLMYWPSTPSDGEFVFHKQDGPTLKADKVLATYKDWHDCASWPTSAMEQTVIAKSAKKQGAPVEKPGLVGMFCRAHDIYSAIETYLPDTYTPCDDGRRFTYTGGSTVAGAVVYEDGQFLYSHHSTDPAGGHLCNAFDLVRLHRFGDLDADVDLTSTRINDLPSYKAMAKLAAEDDAVKRIAVEDRLEGSKAAFSDEQTDDWTKNLKLSKQGAIEATIANLLLILDNDPNLSGAFAINLFTERMCIKKNLPWRDCDDAKNGTPWEDQDDSALRNYVEKAYGIHHQSKLADALNICMMNHSFHPVREYLNGLNWDGEERAERLFIDYLGADNDRYTRAVTRKWLTAAVARVMRPGVKFDNMIILVGRQGIGKSYLGQLLGGSWYSDSFTTVQGKEAYEQLKGVWIMEIGELAAMKKAEVESVKLFISKQDDTYRSAYARHSHVNKRQCVFFGTTNEISFLRDSTGNRRFWPVDVDLDRAVDDVFSLTRNDIDQIWAEAVRWYRSGETLYLSREIAQEAAVKQSAHMYDDPKVAEIALFLDTPVPENWDYLDRSTRRNYMQGLTEVDGPMRRRDCVSVAEIAYELYGIDHLSTWDAKALHDALRRVEGWRQMTGRRSTVYGKQPVYERIDTE